MFWPNAPLLRKGAPMCAASIESKELPSCWATWCLYTLSSTKSIELESVLQEDHLHVLQGLLLGVQQGVQQADLQGEVPALLQDEKCVPRWTGWWASSWRASRWTVCSVSIKYAKIVITVFEQLHCKWWWWALPLCLVWMENQWLDQAASECWQAIKREGVTQKQLSP